LGQDSPDAEADLPSTSDSVENLLAAIAPAQRRSPEQVEAALRLLRGHPLIDVLIEVTDALVMVLNRERQILFASEQIKELSVRSDVAGYRDGEVLGCVHAWDNPAGCGTSAACASCGTATALRIAVTEGRSAEAETLLTRVHGRRAEAHEFRVRATPFEVEGVPLVALSFRDIAAEKRRDALERIFFHDLLNTVAGLHGYSRLALAETPSPEILARIAFLCDRLRDEVLEQRALLAAEGGTLEPEWERTAGEEILRSVERIFAGATLAAGRRLEASACRPGCELVTDPLLLTRVLVNMVKNACEATAAGGTIRISCATDGERCSFAVWNDGAIPDEVGRRIFQRSFSTKAVRGRGLGSYSMKLFGERYLGGRVSFASSVAAGTTFAISLPRAPKLD
jgi:signal transduction histidine kinase